MARRKDRPFSEALQRGAEEEASRRVRRVAIAGAGWRWEDDPELQIAASLSQFFAGRPGPRPPATATRALAKLTVEWEQMARDRVPPTMPTFAQFMERYIPAFNAVAGEHGRRMCTVCGSLYYPTHGAPVYCSDACGDRERKRRPTPSRLRQRDRQWIDHHKPTCTACKKGGACPAMIRRLGDLDDDAIPHSDMLAHAKIHDQAAIENIDLAVPLPARRKTGTKSRR